MMKTVLKGSEFIQCTITVMLEGECIAKSILCSEHCFSDLRRKIHSWTLLVFEVQGFISSWSFVGSLCIKLEMANKFFSLMYLKSVWNFTTLEHFKSSLSLQRDRDVPAASQAGQ